MLILSGVSIVRSIVFNVGAPAFARCLNEVPATTMQWMSNGVVVESATSTQTLDLTFSPVNDSIYNDVYVCRVTREDGMIVYHNFTVHVVGKYRLIILISIYLPIMIFSPSRFSRCCCQ